MVCRQEGARCEAKFRAPNLSPVRNSAGVFPDRRISTAAAVPATTPAPEPPAERELSLVTEREREVAALVARGLTDPPIAEALVIGRRTAEKHVANCLGKLGLSTRTGLAAWAVERGLSAPPPD